jgi:aspartyl-tRNA(Asn)/glutamyl-tRNA(Gln) amidotransferase subunit A
MIKELHQKLISGQITSTQLTEQYFAAISKKDKDIFAYLTLTKDLAMEQARKVDEKISAGGGSAFGEKNGEKIGILEGIPGAIKDVILLKGERATGGSKILDNYIAPYDATVVARLKEAGAVILGKTNLDEFACGSSTENSAYGPTKNPRDLERVPGGSSGGSAAAIAADEAVWALGTDTGGSIRQPASFCGIVGLKPTYGRVSRYGTMAMTSSFDQIGPMGKTVEDVALILNVISGEDHKDATSAQSFGKDYTDYLIGEVKGMKIGVVREYFKDLNPKVRESIEKVIETYKKLGAEIQEIKLPSSNYALPAYYIIMPSELSSNLARFDGIKYGLRADDRAKSDILPDQATSTLLETYLDTRGYNLGPEIKRRIMLGTYSLSSGYYDAYYKKAQQVRTLIKKDFEKVFAEVDLILTPTTPTPAFKIGEKTENPLEMYLSDIFTVTANIAGLPAISVPAPEVEWEGKKLPIGFQLLGKWYDEEGVLRAADAYEKQILNSKI